MDGDGHHQERDGQSNLASHQHRLTPLTPLTRARVGRTHRDREVATRTADRRRCSGQKGARHSGTQADHQHAAVDRERHRQRNVGRRWKETEEHDAQVGDADAECSAGQRDEETFCNQLPHDSAARGTDGQAHGNFAAAHRRSTLEETRDIGAGHAQHRERQPAEHQHHRRHNGIRGGAVGEIGADDQGSIRVGPGIFAAQRRTEHRELGSGLRQRRTGP